MVRQEINPELLRRFACNYAAKRKGQQTEQNGQPVASLSAARMYGEIAKRRGNGITGDPVASESAARMYGEIAKRHWNYRSRD